MDNILGRMPSIRAARTGSLRSYAIDIAHCGPRREPEGHADRIRAHKKRVSREWKEVCGCRHIRPCLRLPNRRRALLRLLADGPMTMLEMRKRLRWHRRLFHKAMYGASGRGWFQCSKSSSHHALWSLTEAGRKALEELR